MNLKKLNNTLFFLFSLFLLSLCAAVTLSGADACFAYESEETSVSDLSGDKDSPNTPVFAAAETGRANTAEVTSKRVRSAQAAIPSSVISDLNDTSLYVFLPFCFFIVFKKLGIIPLGSHAPPFTADEPEPIKIKL